MAGSGDGVSKPRQVWVVKAGDGRNLWLGGVRNDGGPFWRLSRANATRYKRQDLAADAARRCGGVLEVIDVG